jgi:hypothetical protein
MSIDFGYGMQSVELSYNLTINTSDKLSDFVEDSSFKTNLVRFLALPIGLTRGLLTLATGVALIAEQVFKGFGNIIGATFSKNEDEDYAFKTGVKQLFVAFPVSILSLIITAGEAVYHTAATTVGLLLDPAAHAKALKEQTETALEALEDTQDNI